MDTSKNTESPAILLGKSAVILGLLGGAWACALMDPKSGAVQDWSQRRGPVVPHDSFPADCTLCHLGNDWQSIRPDFEFDHEAQTGVLLEGAHAQAECLRCHNDRGPAGTFAARGCAGCHEDLHLGKLGANCQDCHVQDNWRPLSQISLHRATGFDLVGSHAAAACWQCHPGAPQGLFSGTDTECVQCHQADLAQASSPDHLAQGWTDRCDRCHIPTSWSGGGFNHSSFPLLGAHLGADCTQCHVNDVFAGTPRECVDCHSSEYDSSRNPDHAAAGFPTTCETCHNSTSWESASFAHQFWPLTGSHRLEDCNACHGDGTFAGTPNECYDCHAAEFNSTTDPDHMASGFPMNCESCHNTSMWDRANFDHSGWPLIGSHKSTDCLSCHVNDVFEGTPSECVDCHLPEYQGSTEPNHGAAGFDTQCERCHQPTAWQAATYQHDAWPLTGAHLGASCSECHLGRVFAGLRSDCVDCHLADYQGTTDPNHMAAGFPQSCDSCHTTTMWQGAVFNHNFPIDRGDHSRFSCTECHQNPRNFATFACINCHEHNPRDTFEDHDEVRGYVYESSACYSCHMDGKR